MDVTLLYVVACVICHGFSSASQLISIGKNITSSSHVDDCVAERAVDGDTRTSAEECDCCAATGLEFEPWYKLDLDQVYMIHSISVLGRGDGLYDQTLLNMEIKLGTTASNGQVLTRNTDNVFAYNYTLPAPQEGRFVTLTLRGMIQYFVICELMVYAECDNGYFGTDCKQRCFCLHSPCDTTTGICATGGCKEGYKGDRCDTPCQHGRYGRNCKERCGSCFNDVTCNIYDGTCQRCAPGFLGNKCTKRCDSGSYGVNCSETCGHCTNSAKCDTVDGSCPAGCEHGFEGSLCKDRCKAGKFGENCANDCGHCYQGRTCDVVTGVCPHNCSEGYTGLYCKQECEDGTFGKGCNENCGKCLDGEICDKRNGNCSKCEPGYVEPLCKVSQNVGHQTECPVYTNLQLEIVIGATIAIVLIIEGIVAAICCGIRKRRVRKRKKPSLAISGPYEITSRFGCYAEHPYGQRPTTNIYEEPVSPYETAE